MKQHVRHAMMLLAAICGAAVERAEASYWTHSDRFVVDDSSMERTVTYCIAAWRVHLTTSDQDVSDISMAEIPDSIYRVAILDANGRQVAVDISCTNPSQRSAQLGTHALGYDVATIAAVDVSDRSGVGAIGVPLLARRSYVSPSWDSPVGHLRDYYESIGMDPHPTPVRVATPASVVGGFGSDRAMVPDAASMVFGSPGVVLLNGLGVILIGRQLRRRLP